MKKLLATLLCVMMVVVFMPTMAFAADGDATDDVAEVKNISTPEELISAIQNQKDGETWILAAGTYDVGSSLTTMEANINGNASGFVFPITANHLTIKAAEGADVTITSTYDPNTGNWAGQNFITIKGTNVVIEGVKIKGNPNGYYDGQCNKAIELIDGAKDFTLRNVEILPLEDAEEKVSSGSIYVNVADAGETILENVTLYSWINARAVEEGTVTATDVTQDFRNNTYAGYSDETFGYAWNPGISGESVTAENFTIKVDDSIALQEQIFNDNMISGTTVELEAGTYTGSNLIISKDATLVGAEGVIIKPDQFTPVQAVNGESIPYSGIITVKDADVTLKNLTVEGDPEAASKNSALTHSTRYIGIAALDANVTVEGCEVKNITYEDHLQGMQNGFGVYAVSTDDKALILKDTEIEKFNKAGGVIRENVSLTMENCTVTGFGEQGIISQNGIQYAGDATISGSTFKDLKYVADNEWSGGSVAIYNLGEDTTTKIMNTTCEDVDYSIYVSSETGKTTVSGGIYDGSVDGEKEALTIYGGTFEQDVKDFVAPGYSQNSNGTVVSNSVGGGYYPTVQNPTIEASEGVTVTKGATGTTATITVADGYELVDVTVNGVSKGKVTTLTGLKTGDKVVVTAQKIAAPDDNAAVIAAVKSVKLVARSQMSKAQGKKAVKITWYATDGSDVELDGVEIFRSTKRYSGFGTKPIFSTTKAQYHNTAIKAGTKYYYKVRGYKVIGGEKVYTDWSTKAWRTVK